MATDTIQEAIQWITRHHDGGVYEIRIPDTSRAGVVSGYFDLQHTPATEQAVKQYDGQANIYITLNPVKAALSARAHNRLKERTKLTTSGKDILRRSLLLVDVDTKRETGISSTDKEKAQALAVITAVKEYLYEQGWPEPLYADSGNGYHLLYRIDLPNDDTSTALVKSCLDALHSKFSSDRADVDTSVSDANRISKLYGTMACKGDSTEDRPHRRSRIISLPEPSEISDIVSLTLLQELAAMAPVAVIVRQQGDTATKSPKNGKGFDLQGFMEKHGLAVKYTKEGAEKTTYVLENCPFDSTHTGKDVALFLFADGSIGFKCLHNSCADKHWKDVRELFEPGCYERKGKYHLRETDNPAMNDVGNTERFAAKHSSEVKHCSEFGWLYWDGTRWAPGEKYVLEIAKTIYMDILNEAEEAKGKDERNSLLRFAIQTGNERRVKALLSLAESMPEISIEAKQLDRNPWLLNIQNGTVDLQTGKLKPHTKEDYITKLAPVTGDPTVAIPFWEDYLQKVFKGDADLTHFVQKVIGYMLTGITREKKLFVALGGGDNGKGTLFNTMRSILGEDYTAISPPEALMEIDKPAGGATELIARLAGKRYVLTEETGQGKKLNVALIKTVTGGTDSLTARFLHKNSFQFDPELKLVFSTNHKPVIRDQTDSIWRRVVLIPFDTKFRAADDPEGDFEIDLGFKTKLEAEYPGILAWAIQGCCLWQQEGLLFPAAVKEATNEYRQESDILGNFLAEKCSIHPLASETTKDLYIAYCDWCSESSDTPVIKKTFIGCLRQKYKYKKGAHNVRTFYGIGLYGKPAAVSVSESELAEKHIPPMKEDKGIIYDKV